MRGAYPNPISAAGVIRKIRIPQCIFEQNAFRITSQRPLDAIEKPWTGLWPAQHGAHRNALGIDGQFVILIVVGDTFRANLRGGLLDLETSVVQRLKAKDLAVPRLPAL